MSLNKYEKYIKIATSTTSIILPIMTMPQLLVIWMNQDASSVSLLTWSIYLLSAIIWLLYGIVRKDKILLVLNTLLIFIDAGIVLGILIYG